jgi:hypothetical protein
VTNARYVSKRGNASGDGSPANPYLTVQAAIDSIVDDASAAPPYIVIVGPGTFTEAFSLDKATANWIGAVQAPVAFQSRRFGRLLWALLRRSIVDNLDTKVANSEAKKAP